jgi:hypothetical protein
LRQGARVIEDSRHLRLAWADKGRQGGLTAWDTLERSAVSATHHILIHGGVGGSRARDYRKRFS